MDSQEVIYDVSGKKNLNKMETFGPKPRLMCLLTGEVQLLGQKKCSALLSLVERATVHSQHFA